MHYLIYQLDEPCPTLLSPETLDPTEQEAYRRRGKRYLHIRTLLKRELSRHSGEPAERIRFTYNAQGKPHYAPQPFNMSHSGDLLCLAFHHSDIGVDIEQIRPRRGMSAVAERILCAEQLAAWHQRGSRVDEFFACWCAAEALLKLEGKGIWQALQFPFLYREGHITPLFSTATRIELFTPAPGYQGAIAWKTDEATPSVI